MPGPAATQDDRSRRHGLAQLLVSKARYRMIVHLPCRLHKSVADGGADETEAALLQILAHGVGVFRFCRHAFVCIPGVLSRCAAPKCPNIFVEAAEFSLH